MKKLLEGLMSFSAITLIATMSVAQGIKDPSLDVASSGRVIAIAAAVIAVLLNILKQPWTGALMARIPKRLRIIIPIALGGIAGILSSVLGGMNWVDAVVIGLFTGPTAVFAHEAFVEALFGQAKSRTQQ